MRQRPTARIPLAICGSAAYLAWHLRHRPWSETFKKLPRGRRIVHHVRGKHDQEKSVPGSARKARHIEYWVIRHSQAVKRQHAEYGRDTGEENRHLKCNNDKRL